MNMPVCLWVVAEAGCPPLLAVSLVSPDLPQPEDRKTKAGSSASASFAALISSLPFGYELFFVVVNPVSGFLDIEIAGFCHICFFVPFGCVRNSKGFICAEQFILIFFVKTPFWLALFIHLYPHLFIFLLYYFPNQKFNN
jgi:hypothetical protein